MATWDHRVKLKHLMTEQEDHASVQASMNAIADVIEAAPCFRLFGGIKRFRQIPAGDEVFGPVDYANKLLAGVYDFADAHRIWID